MTDSKTPQLEPLSKAYKIAGRGRYLVASENPNDPMQWYDGAFLIRESPERYKLVFEAWLESSYPFASSFGAPQSKVQNDQTRPASV